MQGLEAEQSVPAGRQGKYLGILDRLQVCIFYRVGQNHIYTYICIRYFVYYSEGWPEPYIYGAYMVFWAEKSPNIRSCMMYIYGSGHPSSYTETCAAIANNKAAQKGQCLHALDRPQGYPPCLESCHATFEGSPKGAMPPRP